MTKFILVGGYPYKATDGGKAFAEELVKGFNHPVKILDCLFARPKDNWQAAFLQDKEFFSKHLTSIDFELELADPANFIAQLHWANAIYIRGGKTLLLMDLLNKTSNWVLELKGKTLAGSSAGADLMSKYYYNLDSLKLEEGLGLVAVKTLVHYGSNYNAPNIDWVKVEMDLKNYKENLKILKLPEGVFEIIEA